MNVRFVNIGYGNIVFINKIVSIIHPKSAPIKRLISKAREKEYLIDATQGRKTRGVIITNSNHVILSALQPETILQRLDNEDKSSIQGEEYE